MEGRAGQPESMPQFWGVLARTSDGGFRKYVELDTGTSRRDFATTTVASTRRRSP